MVDYSRVSERSLVNPPDAASEAKRLCELLQYSGCVQTVFDSADFARSVASLIPNNVLGRLHFGRFDGIRREILESR